MNILAHESHSRILYAWRSDPESREIRLPREFKVWPRMPGDCRKVNPPVESCRNGKVVILRRHAQTDVHPLEFVLRAVATVRFDKLGGLAHPGHRAPVFPKKRSAANCNAQFAKPRLAATTLPYGTLDTGEAKHLPMSQPRLSREVSCHDSALSRRFGKERPDNSLHFGSLTLRTLNFFRIVLLHGQDFGSFLAALGAYVFVDGHGFWLVWVSLSGP